MVGLHWNIDPSPLRERLSSCSPHHHHHDVLWEHSQILHPSNRSADNTLTLHTAPSHLDQKELHQNAVHRLQFSIEYHCDLQARHPAQRCRAQHLPAWLDPDLPDFPGYKDRQHHNLHPDSLHQRPSGLRAQMHACVKTHAFNFIINFSDNSTLISLILMILMMRRHTERSESDILMPGPQLPSPCQQKSGLQEVTERRTPVCILFSPVQNWFSLSIFTFTTLLHNLSTLQSIYFTTTAHS